MGSKYQITKPTGGCTDNVIINLFIQFRIKFCFLIVEMEWHLTWSLTSKLNLVGVKMNNYVKGHSVLKLLSEHTQRHTQQIE